MQDKLATESFAAVAEPDIVSGETGRPITIRPLGNDLPGTDPLTPEAALELAGKVASVGGADVRTDLVEGTITFRSRTARTFLLDYDAAYGSAPIAAGRIRVDVREPARTPPDPVAMPDQVTVFGQAATMVDVLANDVDPAGGMLVVQRADARTDDQLDVAVVQGRWVRVSARQGSLTPNPQVVRYTISNGLTSGVEGEITVSQRPAVDDDSPVTQVDRVVVRAGAAISVPVLDNDFSPAGDQLRLVNHLAGEESGTLRTADPDGTAARGDTGSAYVSGTPGSLRRPARGRRRGQPPGALRRGQRDRPDRSRPRRDHRRPGRAPQPAARAPAARGAGRRGRQRQAAASRGGRRP